MPNTGGEDASCDSGAAADNCDTTFDDNPQVKEQQEPAKEATRDSIHTSNKYKYKYKYDLSANNSNNVQPVQVLVHEPPAVSNISKHEHEQPKSTSPADDDTSKSENENTKYNKVTVGVTKFIARRPHHIILSTIAFCILVTLLALFASDFQLATENKKGKSKHFDVQMKLKWTSRYTCILVLNTGIILFQNTLTGIEYDTI